MEITMLIKILKRKLKRKKGLIKDIQALIDSGETSSITKQKFFELKGHIEELEDNIDLAEGLLQKDD